MWDPSWYDGVMVVNIGMSRGVAPKGVAEMLVGTRWISGVGPRDPGLSPTQPSHCWPGFPRFLGVMPPWQPGLNRPPRQETLR
jgi:hypothetical protein